MKTTQRHARHPRFQIICFCCIGPGTFQPALVGLLLLFLPHSIPADIAFAWPVNPTFTLTQDYSAYNAIWNSKYHVGMDLVTSDRAVYAAADGNIWRVKNNEDGFDYAIMIDHGQGVYSLYCHLNNFSQSFTQGQYVTRGQQLGVMGQTGGAQGVHLHFEIRPDSGWNLTGQSDGYAVDLSDGYGYRDPRVYIYPFAETTISPVVVRVVATANLNVRSGPGTSSDQRTRYAALTQLQPGQKLVAFRQNGDWYKIHLPHANAGISGWSAKVYAGYTYLALEPSAGQIEVTWSWLYVRTGAGTSSPNVTTRNGLAYLKIWNGQRFAVIDQTLVGSITWYRIDLPNSVLVQPESDSWGSELLIRTNNR